MRAILAAAIMLACLTATPALAQWTPERTDRLGKFTAEYRDGKMVTWCRNGKCVPVRKYIARSTVTAEPQTMRTPFGTTIRSSVSLSGVDGRLLTFIRAVSSACGPVKVISAVRRSYVGRRRSCHWDGRAVDYQIGDPSCALKYAAGKPVGHSIDYYGVQALSRGMPMHYHASTCSSEMRVRFVHRGSSYRGKRYTKRYKQRYRTYRRARYAYHRSRSYRRR